MKKILIIPIIGILFLSGAGASNIIKEKKIETFEINKSFTFSIPTITEEEKYIIANINETEKTYKDTGKPELPMVPYSLNLPFGSKNIKITCQTKNEYEIELTKKIIPTSKSYIKSYDNNINNIRPIEDEIIYSSSEKYPTDWYDFKITAGLNDQKTHVIHVSLYIFPIRYSPAQNKAFYITDATIKITYEPPKKIISFNNNYDMVIIAPSIFSSTLQQLVNHKNSIGIRTYLKTTEDIYSQYTGFDKPEQIKYFIKDAIETEGITYVLLIGGLKKYFNAEDRDDANQGTKDWYLPVRYTNIVETSSVKDYGTISDLYYADIYDSEGNFSSWDSNDDGIYAKWSNSPGKDLLDLNPDVYTTRLPCRNTKELKTMIKKIIDYETTTPSTGSWYKRMVGIAGESFDMYKGQPDGEYLTDMTFDFMKTLVVEEVRIYASNKETGGLIPVKNDIINAFNKGARFIYLSGHGHPLRWDTHPVGNLTVWMGGIHSRDLWTLFNIKKLPIVVVGGCHNAQFNITWWKTFKSSDDSYDKYYWTHGDPGAVCFNEKLLTIPWGGAVATLGGTGLTTSYTSDPNTLNAELETNFFYEIGQNGANNLGEAFYKTTQKFIDENKIGLLEAHSITIWITFGDPSLKIV